jgi:hypothetical protein
MTYSVPFADYEAAQQAAAIILNLREELRQRDRAILALIAAAGGSISVPIGVIGNPPDTLTVMEDPANFCMIYTTSRKADKFID